MENEKVVAILWTLVAVTLVLWFVGLVSKATDEQLWSHETPSHRGITTPRYQWRYP